ncbi:MFS transporter [Streptacidiphilus sp. ASG 303]|uniref:MFS transporter n=1 Tax=Streptacidiphilus sp. ASG 303 TaxID=2896847 RepID=UPI001E5FD903|nr:MFS transporter [Streptacidiphilus sp. ASG 303]MCD0483644.1 MFS transporter [Streptacidiphilus sp. ASG 303]
MPQPRTATLVITGAGSFMVLLDVTVVSVALPSIGRDLHASLSGLAWVVDACTLPFAATLLTCGTLGDRVGHRRLFTAGLALFTVGSALCAAAPSAGWLLAGRAVQGVAGAAVSPSGLALITAAFPREKERARALGTWSAVGGLALAAGPLLGGLLIEASGDWRWVFRVNLPIGAAAVLAGTRLLPAHAGRRRGSVDLPGQVLSTAGLVSVVYALAEGGVRGWTDGRVAACLGAGAVLLAAFTARQAAAAEPMLPLGLFRRRLFGAGGAATFAVGFALTSHAFFMSQYFQDVQRTGALGSGLRSLPTTVGIFAAAPLAGRLAARYGYRVPVTAGTLAAGTGALSLTGIRDDTGYASLWWPLALVGVGFGLALSPLVGAVLAAVPPQAAGAAAGAANAARQLGGTVGVAVLSALAAGRIADGSGLTAAVRTAFLVNGAVLAATAALSWPLLQHPRTAPAETAHPAPKENEPA